MKNSRSFRFEGFASIFVLVGMLLLVVAMPIAVKLVQQNQESRSKAASGISQTKKCKDVGGICQKKSSTCAGTYVSNLCSKGDKGVSCCAKVRDTEACLNVGGRCKDKDTEASSSGTIKKDLCSGTNGSDVVCLVADGSTNQCTAMEGTCVSSADKTSGGSCNAGSSSGFLNLKYSCGEENKSSLCCIPSSNDIDGECIVYSGEPLTAVPTGLCKSGVATWDGGDMVGTDGSLNWKCRGFNDAVTVDCSAKFKIITDTQDCLNVGGRCKDRDKEATGSGSYRTDKPDLCSVNKSNPSNVGCWVATGSDSPCTAMTGKCIGSAGVTTSGGSCVLTSQTTGVYNLNYACKATTSACCLPTTVSLGGQCKDYGKQVLSSVPASLCVSGTESWEDGDNLANDGTLNWKCVGSAGSVGVDCSAKFKTNGKCNTDYSGDGKTVSTKPTQEQACSAGTLAWLNSGKVKNGYYSWKCKGINGGSEVGCKVKYVATSGEVPVNSVSLDKTFLNLTVGGRDSLVATIAPTNATDQSKVWTSDKISVATVSDSGVITGVSSGTANITVKTNDGSKTASAIVTVSLNTTTDTDVPVTAITLSPTNLITNVGKREIFKATVTPENATNTITWSSSDDSILTVSGTGLMEAVSQGTADVIATASNGVKAKVTVKVEAVTTEVTPGDIESGEVKISFKFALRGVTPDSASCFSNLENLKVEVMNTTSRKYETGILTGFEALDGQKNAAGDQIFQVTDLALDSSKFSGANSLNYVKIKGPFHLQARMCQNNQSGKLSDITECDISLNGDKVYDFSKYSLLSGDINQDGMVNTIDYGKLKSYFNEEVDCGTNGDLNMDGIVNATDAVLIKNSLSSKDDE